MELWLSAWTIILSIEQVEVFGRSVAFYEQANNISITLLLIFWLPSTTLNMKYLDVKKLG